MYGLFHGLFLAVLLLGMLRVGIEGEDGLTLLGMCEYGYLFMCEF